MVRGNDPGRDFDRQFEQNRRAGQARAARGEGPWADDKYLRDLRAGGEGPGGGGGGNNEGCGKATLFLLGTLGGAAWWLSDIVARAV